LFIREFQPDMMSVMIMDGRVDVKAITGGSKTLLPATTRRI